MSSTVLSSFMEQVRANGHRRALESATGGMTYNELEARSNRVANLLTSMGVGEGALVAISLERAPSVIAAILGVLKSGAAYVPLDPANPDERLRLILDDARPAAFLTESSLAGRFRDATNLVEIDRDGRLASASAEPTRGTPKADALAYVIYTSGTTGRPKGVMITHANIQSLIAAAQPHFRFGAEDVWSLFHSYGFDVSVWEMWGALSFGGRLVIPDADTVRSPDSFYELLARERVTVLCQTPSAFNSILELEDRGVSRGLAIRYVILAGEALDPRKLRSWFGRRGDESPRIVNMYGITETTVHTTYRRITGADCDAEAWSPIGTPLANSEIRLLDERGTVVSDGEIGEIHVLGEGVARGYLNRPDLTQERFLTSSDGRRMYRSGDLARRTSDGDLEYHGRVDAQVQIRGFRVELGEIESALRRSPSVSDAVVTYRSDRPGGRLVAYVVPRGGRALSAQAEVSLREQATTRLPAYMHPSVYVAIDTLPLTANGKVNRKALPDPPEAGAASAPLPESGLSPTEARVATIWARILGIRGVSAETDFFAAGGHSLLAVEAMIRAQEEFGLEIPLGTMFEHTTVHSVAAVIDRLTADTEELVI